MHRLRRFGVAFCKHKSDSGAARIAERGRQSTSARAGRLTQSSPLVLSRSSVLLSPLLPPHPKVASGIRRSSQFFGFLLGDRYRSRRCFFDYLFIESARFTNKK